MQAYHLIRRGAAHQAFEIRDIPSPSPGEGEVLIAVEGFGLNFADVMARLGMYPAAPPMPGVLGYDVVGRIQALGTGVKGLTEGMRVVAMTRFGGYAEEALADARAVVEIPEDIPLGVAAALATQAGTAYHMAMELVNLHEGNRVLVHAAAGGVGTCLVQLAKHKGCEVFGTAGSPEKLEYLRELGVDHPINYRQEDFAEKIQEIVGREGLDVIFDPIGGKSLKDGMGILGIGGRMVTFGASSFTNTKGFISKLRNFLSFGFYHPMKMLGKSQAIIAVNMLPIADHKPEVIQRVFKACLHYYQQGVLQPRVGGVYPSNELDKAHDDMEKRRTTGKLTVKW